MYEYELRIEDLEPGRLIPAAFSGLKDDTMHAIRQSMGMISTQVGYVDIDLDLLLFEGLRLVTAVNNLRQIQKNERENGG